MELRTLAAADVAALAGWLPAAARQAGCDRWSDAEALREAIGSRQVLIASKHDAQSFIDYQMGAPARDAAHVRFLAVPSGQRRVGTGHQSALALEQRLPASIKRVYVSVPARLGLALYFWLRLGYRPLTQREWPAPPDDPPSVWMVRELR